MNKLKKTISILTLINLMLLCICINANTATTKVNGVANVTIYNASGKVVKTDVLNANKPAAVYTLTKAQKISVYIYGPGSINVGGQNESATLQDLGNDPNGEWGSDYVANADKVEVTVGYDAVNNLMVMSDKVIDGGAQNTTGQSVVKNVDGTTAQTAATVQAAALSNTQLVQDAAIYAKLMELKEVYPQGTRWNMMATYKTVNKGRINSGTVMGCQAFGYMAQDYAFGKGTKIKGKATGLENWVNKNLLAKYGSWSYGSKYYEETGTNGAVEIIGYDGTDPKVNGNFEKIYANLRVGDLVQSAVHMGIVLSKDDTGITIAEGNYNGSVSWGRRITKESLRRALMRVESAY